MSDPYFWICCNICGWEGYSGECGLISYGDDADVTCPECEQVFICDEVLPPSPSKTEE